MLTPQANASTSTTERHRSEAGPTRARAPRPRPQRRPARPKFPRAPRFVLRAHSASWPRLSHGPPSFAAHVHVHEHFTELESRKARSQRRVTATAGEKGTKTQRTVLAGQCRRRRQRKTQSGAAVSTRRSACSPRGERDVRGPGSRSSARNPAPAGCSKFEHNTKASIKQFTANKMYTRINE